MSFLGLAIALLNKDAGGFAYMQIFLTHMSELLVHLFLLLWVP